MPLPNAAPRKIAAMPSANRTGWRWKIRMRIAYPPNTHTFAFSPHDAGGKPACINTMMAMQMIAGRITSSMRSIGRRGTSVGRRAAAMMMTHERGEEDRSEVRRGERGDAALHHEGDGHRQDQQEWRLQPDRERVPEDDGVPREHDDEREQINREWNDPQQRDRCDVGREIGRDSEQHARRHERE